jgi:Holliday junction resolvase RusA-like endonuclease
METIGGGVMKERIIVIPGKVAAKGRPRFTKAGHTYTPEKTVAYEDLVKLTYMGKYGQDVLEGPLSATIIHCMAPTKTDKAKKSLYEQMLRGDIPPTKKPDLDNVVKSVLDSLNGIAYKDDAQVCELIVSRVYFRCDCLVVTIKECTTAPYYIGRAERDLSSDADRLPFDELEVEDD